MATTSDLSPQRWCCETYGEWRGGWLVCWLLPACGVMVVAHCPVVASRACRLDSPVDEGDIIHVVFHPHPCAPAASEVVVVSQAQNALVVLPDVLLSPTRVGAGLQCTRRAVLGELVTDSFSSHAALMGQVRSLCNARYRGHARRCSPLRAVCVRRWLSIPQLKHALFEAAILSGNFDGEFLAAAALDIVRQPSTMQGLYAIDCGEGTALSQLREVIQSVMEWGKRFFSASARPPTDRQTVAIGADGRRWVQLAVQRAMATEDSVWSPLWGVKGQLDAVVAVKTPVGAKVVVGPQPRQHLKTASLAGAKVGWVGRAAGDGSGSGSGGGSGGGSGSGSGVSVRVLPLELKTGKGHQSHHAQVSMYSLLMADRYGAISDLPRPVLLRRRPLGRSHTLPSPGAAVAADRADVMAGLLAYVRKDNVDMFGVPAKWGELVALLSKRNMVAKGLHEFMQHRVTAVGHAAADAAATAQVASHGGSQALALPAMLRDRRSCSSCFSYRACTLYHAAVEGGDGTTSGLGDMFTASVSHLSPAHAAYFLKWDRLLAAEDGDGLGHDAPLWGTTPQQRAASGRCAHDLRLVHCGPAEVAAPAGALKSGHAAVGTTSGSGGEYEYTFEVRGAAAHTSTATGGVDATQGTTRSLLDLSLAEGDWVVVSVQRGPVSVMRGSIRSLTRHRIVVSAVQKPSLVTTRSTQRGGVGASAPTSQCGAMHSQQPLTQDDIVAMPSSGLGGDIEDIAGGPQPSSSSSSSVSILSRLTWRVDKGELRSTSRQLRSNLVTMLVGPTVEWDDELAPPTAVTSTDDAPAGASPSHSGQRRREDRTQPTFGDVKRKLLVVDLVAPRFYAGRCLPWLADPAAPPASSFRRENPWLPVAGTSVLDTLRAGFEQLNPDQVGRVLQEELLGMRSRMGRAWCACMYVCMCVHGSVALWSGCFKRKTTCACKACPAQARRRPWCSASERWWLVGIASW